MKMTNPSTATRKLFNMSFKRDKAMTQERYEKGLCFICGDPGHKARQCPQRESFARPKLNFAAFRECCDNESEEDHVTERDAEERGSDGDMSSYSEDA